jgi:TonB family protein
MPTPPEFALAPSASAVLFGVEDDSRLVGPRTPQPNALNVPVTGTGANNATSGGGVPVPAADPATMSDSESDAFSKNQGGAEIDSFGNVSARFGRKVKSVRPRFTYSATFDFLQHPRVVMSVKTDETGKVTSVEILRSSGIKDIDQPSLLAMYEFWIEPPKGKDGKPKSDVMIWEFVFH